MLFFSQFYGAQDHDNIRRSFGMTLIFMMISAIVFGCFAVFTPSSVMRLYTDSETIQKIGIPYIRLVGFSYPFQVIAMAQSALLRSTGHVHIPLIGGICAVITNFIVNFVLIFGYLGFPAMGVAGAAVGTIISCIVNVTVIMLLSKARHVPYVLDFSMHFRWNRTLLKQYLKKSAPIIANEAMIGIGNMMINIVLGHQADYAIAATAVFHALEGIIVAFLSGFSNASTVLIGNEIGAGEHAESWSRAYRLVYLCQILTLLICLALILIHTPLLMVMGLSGNSFRTAYGMLLIYTVVSFIRMGNWCMNDTYRTGGDSAFGSILEIIFMFCMVQPAIHFANDLLHWPFLAVFALCYCDEPIRYIIMQIHMYSGKWIRPVSGPGKATIENFRKRYGITIGKKEQIHM